MKSLPEGLLQYRLEPTHVGCMQAYYLYVNSALDILLYWHSYLPYNLPRFLHVMFYLDERA